MRFTHQELHGLGDAQQNFEQLEGRAILDRLPTSFLQLLSAQKRVLNWGVTVESWNNSAQVSPTFTIAHGLGITPLLVIPISATGAGVSYTWTGGDATNFTVVGWNAVALNQAVSVAWLAIG